MYYPPLGRGGTLFNTKNVPVLKLIYLVVILAPSSFQAPHLKFKMLQI